MTVNTAKPRTAIVVVAHRSYVTLDLCLQGFRTLVDHAEDLIFVDNGSGGALTDWATQKFPGITIISLAVNQLFCGGYNTGIRRAMESNYTYVLIANADTEVVNPGFLIDLIEAMQYHPKAAFIGPLVYFRDKKVVQTTCLRFPSFWRSVLVWLPYRFMPGKVSYQPVIASEVEFLNGVCVLCRVQALCEIGLMDETFGAYVEDTDWSWRARQMGWTSRFCPVPSLIHHEEPHGYEHHSFKSFLLKRNTVLWYLKTHQRGAARGYAFAAIALARLRTWFASNQKDKRAYSDFAEKLSSVYRHLLTGESVGLWYGPPIQEVSSTLNQASTVSRSTSDVS